MLKKLIISVLLLLFINSSFSQSSAITIDGKFDDWAFDDWINDIATYTDTNETLDGVDLIELQATNDEDYLYLHITLNQEIDLTEIDNIPHQIGLFIDSDNNTATGFANQDGYGTEIGLLFYDFRVHYNMPEYSLLNINDVRLNVAPTVTSNQFEIAIRRDIVPDGTYPLFTTPTIKLLFKNDLNSDTLPNIGNVFSYTFDDTPVRPYVPVTLEKETTEQIRVLAYNVLSDGLNDPQRVAYFERTIKAINPDIVGFSESYNTSPTYVKALFDEWLPTDNQNGWFVEQLGGLITVSKWAIIKKWDAITRQFPVLIDLPEQYNTNLLFTNAHLNCCANDNARQDQVDQYARFILELKDGRDQDIPKNTPFIYAGDLNLVGLSQQLNTLLTGNIQDTDSYGQGGFLDWDDSELTEQNCLHTESRTNYTWRAYNEPFMPGKLDYIIFSDYVLNAEKSYILQTETMPQEKLERYDLTLYDTLLASDHLPVVTDFTINQEVLSVKEHTTLTQAIYPNPAENDITIQFKDTETYTITLFNSLGRTIFSTKQTTSKVTLPMNTLGSGLYLLKIRNSKGENSRHKIIKK